ncbi:STY4528 family pathogenicity island replication protein [Pseudomonas aeruginosa]
MADYHGNITPQAPDALFTTPTALMLDIRLTPLERNGWQVLRMLRADDGRSSLANLAQLRRYLTATPLGQRAGYETAWRALTVLRLTGWISLVGQQRDPLTGHVLSEMYQVHESALPFHQACELDASLSQLLQVCIDHENNQVGRIALHIRDALERTATDIQTGRRDDDDPPPPTPPSAEQQMVSADSAGEPRVLEQNAPTHQTMQRHSPTYKELKYKKYVGTARAHTRETAGTLPLPPCLERAADDQRRDVQVALRRLSQQARQEVLQELEVRHRDGTVRNAVAYLFALIRRVGQGEFRFWAGRRLAAKVQQASQRISGEDAQASSSASKGTAPTLKHAAPEVVRSHLDSIRAMLHMPVKVGDLAEGLMQSSHWQPSSA